MKSIEDLPEKERLALGELKLQIGREFANSFRLTLFGSKARGDAEPDSDIDILVELDTPQISLSEKRKLQRIAGAISLKSCVLICLLIVDRHTREEKGDYSIFQNIREEGIAL